MDSLAATTSVRLDSKILRGHKVPLRAKLELINKLRSRDKSGCGSKTRGGGMGRWLRKLTAAGTATMLAWASGCVTPPPSMPPTIPLLSPEPQVAIENPLWLPSGPNAYGAVFEKIEDIMTEYFEIRYSNRYDGRIDTYPRVAPGFERPWQPGSPDFYGRLHATLQSIRHRGEVQIETAKDGGFFVKVVIYKELEDLARPIQATSGAAAFRTDITVERQFEVIEPFIFETTWIPMGRDTKIEQVILERLKKCF